MGKHRIGIDLGGTKTEVIIVDDKHEMLHRKRISTPGDIPYETILQSIQGLYDHAVGLIPEIEVLKDLPVEKDEKTGGIATDDSLHSTEVKGLFSCGNAHHVYDLVDYVSDSGEVAGAAASRYVKELVL